jgi:hypothetical protein
MPRKNRIKKWIIYLLTMMIISMSFFFYYYLINLDKKYSNIIKREATLYSNVQNINYGANRGYLLLYKILETNNIARRDSLITTKKLMIQTNDSLINEILFDFNKYKDKSFLNNVISSRESYIQDCLKFENYLITNNKDSAKDLLINQIEPKFLKYQTDLKLFIQANSIYVIENSGNITSDVKKSSFFVLILGLSPIIIFSLFLVFWGVLLVLVIIFLRDKEYKRIFQSEE